MQDNYCQLLAVTLAPAIFNKLPLENFVTLSMFITFRKQDLVHPLQSA
jgi:hypothetical protein